MTTLQLPAGSLYRAQHDKPLVFEGQSYTLAITASHGGCWFISGTTAATMHLSLHMLPDWFEQVPEPEIPVLDIGTGLVPLRGFLFKVVAGRLRPCGRLTSRTRMPSYAPLFQRYVALTKSNAIDPSLHDFDAYKSLLRLLGLDTSLLDSLADVFAPIPDIADMGFWSKGDFTDITGTSGDTGALRGFAAGPVSGASETKR